MPLSEEQRRLKKEKLDRLIRLADEKMKTDPVLRVMADDYIPGEKKKEVETKEIPKKINRPVLVLDNWEKAKKEINASQELGILIKKEVDKDTYQNNEPIRLKYNDVVWQAIESYVRTGNMPESHYPLDIPGIILELKPTKEHLRGYKLKHFVTASFLDLSKTEELQKYFNPKNLDLVEDKRDYNEGKINVPE
jgi:hypothetical protein